MSSENLESVKKTLNESLVRNTRSLALDPKKQSAVIGHLFDPRTNMFKYLIGVAEKEWFANILHGAIWQAVQSWHKKYGKCPTVEELTTNNQLYVLEKTEISKIKDLLGNALSDASVFRAPPLRDEIQAWMHAKILQNIYVKGSHLWNNDKLQESAQIIEDGLDQLNATKWMETSEQKVTALADIARDMSSDHVVQFGISGIDTHLLPDSKFGGLRRGDQTVLMAPVNIGKTSALITVAIHNIRSNNDVLFVSHEGHKSDLRLKMIRCYLSLMDEVELQKALPGLPDNIRAIAQENPEKIISKLRGLAELTLVAFVRYLSTTWDLTDRSSYFFQILCAVLGHAQSHLTFIPIHKAGMFVEDAILHIERAQELWQDSHVDSRGAPKGYDLFVCDYPGVLSTKQNSKGNLQWRHQQQIVYDQFVQLALQHDWHSLVAIQTNRDGSKVNNHTNSFGPKRFLTNEDVSECWGAIMSATNVITLNRPPQAQMAGRITFLITKSRSASVNYAVTCYSNFAQSVTHSDSLGYVSYFGTSEMQGVIHSYMKSGQCRAVTPEEAIIAVQEDTEEDLDTKESKKNEKT
jgi:hypothetical protein